jgi:glycosyltransferase involved in cell wall biosynthesis
MNKVLIVTYYWPPSGGAGVQRWLKFSKYLPEFGWEPIIITVDPAYAAYPVTDESLAGELSSSVKVYKTPAVDYFSIYKKDKTKIPTAGFANSIDNSLSGKIQRFIRGNFFIPDPRRGWNKFAFKKACEIIEAEGISHVITTSPPHSTQLIGLKIKKKYPGIKWVADLRDPWTDIYYYDQFYPTFFSKRIDLGFEKNVLRKADRIITIGSTLKKIFSSKVPGITRKIDVISNGYDDGDFNNVKPSTPDIFTISYTGTLSDTYPIDGFMSALNKFKERGNGFKLKFIGTVSPKQKEFMLSSVDQSNIEFIGSVDHITAIRYMIESSLLLLIIPDHKSSKSIITGKLFEYIASGKPVLCLGPVDGDAATILELYGFGKCFSYRDINSIENFIFSAISNPVNLQSKSIELSHRNIVKKLVSFLG